MTETPRLSVIVIVHHMPVQAMNTLYSLCADYQMGISSKDYEVLVVENESQRCLDPLAVAALGRNFHYHRRRESGVSPAAAINQALSLCRGDRIGLLIDGARMLTPGVLHQALLGAASAEDIVAVPAYYLSQPGSEPGEAQTILDHEANLLARVNWRSDGYALFREAIFSNGNARGYLNQMMECNALFCSAAALRNIGGADERFNLKGGGSLNLHLYRQLATQCSGRLWILAGEGNFHQFHGGTSTTAGTERDTLVASFNEQLNSFWPDGFKGITREPWLLGQLPEQTLDALAESAGHAGRRLSRMHSNGKDAWADETSTGYRHGEH